MKPLKSIAHLKITATVDQIFGNTDLTDGLLKRLRKIIGVCMGERCKTSIRGPQDLTVQHIVMRSKGGKSMPSNVRILCRPCHDIEDGMAVICPHCKGIVPVEGRRKT